MNQNNKAEQPKDMVEKPKHYQGRKGLEVYDIFENFLRDPESHYAGNVLKYVLRYKEKNGLEDLRKAEQFIQRLIKIVEEEEEKKVF